MDEHIDGKFERLYESLGEIRAQLVSIRIDLNHHIERTRIAEERLELLDKDITRLRGFFTVAGWLVAGLATILTILNTLNII